VNRSNNLGRTAIQILASAAGLLMLVPPVLAAAPSPLPLSIAKECSKFTARPGDYCTITKSSLAAIPVGTKAIYYGPVLGPAILSTDVLLDAGDGNTALGYCNVDFEKGVGVCTFWAGSGTLAGFQALVNLTVDSTGLFHWDGAYSMAR
jgi:hypothetical protein